MSSGALSAMLLLLFSVHAEPTGLDENPLRGGFSSFVLLALRAGIIATRFRAPAAPQLVIGHWGSQRLELQVAF
jgi:hypothetical protein